MWMGRRGFDAPAAGRVAIAMVVAATAVMATVAPPAGAVEEASLSTIVPGERLPAETAEGVPGLAFVDDSGRLMVDRSIADAASGCRRSCRVWADLRYVDSEAGVDVALGRYQISYQGSSTATNPAVAVNLPRTAAPYTHVTILVGSGSQTATSVEIELLPPVPETPMDVVVRSWRGTGAGYAEYSVSVEPSPTIYLPGRICQGSSCRWTLWLVTADGTLTPLKTDNRPGHNSPVAGTYSVDPGQRLTVSLTNSYLGLTEWSQPMALPESAAYTISGGVNVPLATDVLEQAVASGADGLALCAPMQEVRDPNDGFTTRAFLACMEAFTAGGASRVTSAMLTLGARALALLVANAATDPVTREPRVQRPAPTPNPTDTPDVPVPIAGDLYWSVLDRIEVSLRERVATHQPVNDDQWRTAARTCYDYAAALWSGLTTHPCQTHSIFFPGSDILAAAQHKAAAIAENPAWVRLTRGQVPNLPHTWYANESECAGRSISTPCDEFPYYSTQQAGPGASLRVIPIWPSSAEGGFLGSGFYPACRVTTGTPFLVVPTVIDADVPSNALAPSTFWACS